MPLSKERVLCAAVQLADHAGVASLPMRKLAETLGVEAMSLYHYITDKDEILDGMVDLVFGEIELPSLEADWKATMRQRAISARDALVRHPWAIGVLESRANPRSPAAGGLSSGSPPAHNQPVRPLIRGPRPPPGGRPPGSVSVLVEEAQQMTGTIHVADDQGDTTHTWDTTDPRTVRAIEELFRQAQATGRLVYRHSEDGRGHQVRLASWNPAEHTELFVAPRLAGG